MINKNKLHTVSQRLKLGFIIIALVIVVVSTFFTNSLSKSLAIEEQKKVKVWAEAMRRIILADEDTDIDFFHKIIADNTTIPIVITDKEGNVDTHRNINVPTNNREAFFNKQINRMKESKPVIEIYLDENLKHYCYFDDSRLLKWLYYFPYIQFGVITIFILISFFAFSSAKKAEQNQVWVGLSKETAHQLGTPISSLLAWMELFRSRHPDDGLLDEMDKDVRRLKIIAERFSKIGSAPTLESENLNRTIDTTVKYMINRSSQKIKISTHFPAGPPTIVKLNVPLFEWVIENLCKNAIDAMDGSGSITIDVEEKGDEVIIDVKDTGKGVEKKQHKAIFTPGFTTKKRGWGLGLSLVKRIVEEYHGGKIFVKQSEINVGTTFRILLHKK
ncbi:MAG: HAMP domain-containing histidine kinase [Prevotellaceae bacterium]|jgi:two-component sensor histidine kinase|nr:HAMP domain-containing histidine kinase [Prevotellaceae bacterium]